MEKQSMSLQLLLNTRTEEISKAFCITYPSTLSKFLSKTIILFLLLRCQYKVRSKWCPFLQSESQAHLDQDGASSSNRPPPGCVLCGQWCEGQ